MPARVPFPAPRERLRPTGPARRAAAVLCGLLALSGAARADGDDLQAVPLEELGRLKVFSASEFARQTIDAPSNVTVITAEEIKAFGYRTLADILKSIPGLHVANDKSYSYLGVRGFLWPGDYNTRFLVLLDGQRINDSVYDQGSIGLDFPLDVDFIERVEFVPGPGSAIFGSSAFLGVVHVTTKSASARGGEGRVSFTDAGGRKVSASLGRVFDNGASLMLAGSVVANRGRDIYFPEFDSPESNHGVAQGLDYERYKSVFVKYVYGGFSLVAGNSARSKGDPTAPYAQVFNDPRSRIDDDRSFLGLKLEKSIAPKLDLIASLAYGRYDYGGIYPMDYPPVVENIDITRSRWVDGELRLYSTRWDGHKIVAGIELRKDLESLQRNFDALGEYVNADVRRQVWGFYLQDEIALGERVSLSIGARHDHSADYGGVTTPRVGLVIRPDLKTTIKAQLGAAYRNPNLYELYYLPAAEGASGPVANLKQETIRTGELSVERFIRNDWRVLASVFSFDTNQLISPIVMDDGNSDFANRQAARAKGIELQSESVHAGGVRLRLSYSWQQVKSDSGLQLARSPRNVGRANLIVPLSWRGAKLGAEWIAESRRSNWAGQNVGGYGLLNLTLSSIRITPDTELAFSVYNALDHRIADPASQDHLDSLGRRLVAIPQDGRVWRVQLTVRF